MLQSLELYTATPFPPWAVGLSLGIGPPHRPGPLKGRSVTHPHWGRGALTDWGGGTACCEEPHLRSHRQEGICTQEPGFHL